MAKVDQALQFSIHGVSLDQGVGPERDRPIGEFLVDESTRTAEDEMIRREDSDLVNQAIGVLTQQEKTVLGYRYGLETGRTMTLKEVGAILKISRERVRQIECRAKSRIRKIFDDRRSIKATPIRPRSVH
jgi:RNA polymerase primary sigma factor